MSAVSSVSCLHVPSGKKKKKKEKKNSDMSLTLSAYQLHKPVIYVVAICMTISYLMCQNVESLKRSRNAHTNWPIDNNGLHYTILCHTFLKKDKKNIS